MTLLMSWPARVSSTKPMSEAMAVDLMSWTRKPGVGGMEMRKACGRNDEAEPLDVAEAEAGAGLPLVARHAFDGAVPDFAEEGAGFGPRATRGTIGSG